MRPAEKTLLNEPSASAVIKTWILFLLDLGDGLGLGLGLGVGQSVVPLTLVLHPASLALVQALLSVYHLIQSSVVSEVEEVRDRPIS